MATQEELAAAVGTLQGDVTVLRAGFGTLRGRILDLRQAVDNTPPPNLDIATLRNDLLIVREDNIRLTADLRQITVNIPPQIRVLQDDIAALRQANSLLIAEVENLKQSTLPAAVQRAHIGPPPTKVAAIPTLVATLPGQALPGPVSVAAQASMPTPTSTHIDVDILMDGVKDADHAFQDKMQAALQTTIGPEIRLHRVQAVATGDSTRPLWVVFGPVKGQRMQDYMMDYVVDRRVRRYTSQRGK